MAIGERIKYFRTLRGMTQKSLGMDVGFDDNTADVRMAQYESGTRTPKAELTKALAAVLDVSPLALDVPDIDSEQGLMHTLFTLEDLYGFKVEQKEDGVSLRFENRKGSPESIFKMLSAWAAEAEKYRNGDITKEEYDRWRRYFPKFDTTQHWVKVPSQELSDALIAQFKDKLKDM